MLVDKCKSKPAGGRCCGNWVHLKVLWFLSSPVQSKGSLSLHLSQAEGPQHHRSLAPSQSVDNFTRQHHGLGWQQTSALMKPSSACGPQHLKQTLACTQCNTEQNESQQYLLHVV